MTLVPRPLPTYLEAMKRFAVLLGLLPATAGCMSFNSIEIPLRAKESEFSERTVREGDGGGKVALVDLEGILHNESEESLLSSRDSAVVAFVEKLKLAEADPAVKAVVVRVDSPGGDVTTSDILHNELAAFRARKGVPVVAAFMGISASGGYYVSAACDAIVAHPTTLTGSIGVIALHVSLAGLLDKVGVKVVALKSGERKDVGSIFKDLSDEDRRHLQGLVEQYHNRFVEVVARGRKGRLTTAEVRGLADGRVFTAPQALEAKLVDRIGYLDDAVAEAASRADLKEPSVVMYSRRPDTLRNAYSQPAASAPASGGELDAVRRLLGFRFYYLWDPYILGK